MSTQAIQQMITDAAARYGVPANLALGVASHESGFNPNAVNTSNPNGTRDWGVMQLNDTTVQTMGVANPLDPAQNIDAGVRLLASLLARYGGDQRLALWAYASGPGNVGPDKTPNAIAQGFITYVSAYGGGPAPAPAGPADSPGGEPASAGTLDAGADFSPVDDAAPFQAASVGELSPAGLLALLGVGLALWWIFTRE